MSTPYFSYYILDTKFIGQSLDYNISHIVSRILCLNRSIGELIDWSIALNLYLGLYPNW